MIRRTRTGVAQIIHGSRAGKDIGRIRRAAKDICSLIGISRFLIVNIVLVDNTSITALNRKYHRKNRPTDVMTFSYEYDAGISKQVLEGDVVISTDQVARNARVYGNTFFRELMTVITHGILHVIGYADYTVRDRRNMFEKQDEILARVIGADR